MSERVKNRSGRVQSFDFYRNTQLSLQTGTHVVRQEASTTEISTCIHIRII